MAAVVRVKGKGKNHQPMSDGGKYDENKLANGNSELNTPLLNKNDDKADSVFIDVEKALRPITNKKTPEQNGFATNGLLHSSEDIEDGEVIGVITLEDVLEELLQEEIVDETDVYVDVHKRIPVAAAAASSSVARAPSTRRLPSQRAAGCQGKQGQIPKKSGG